MRVVLLMLCLVMTSCGEDESGETADFDGFWDFDLTVKGMPCPGVTSGPDCFLILQTGTELLVVDAVNGNLTGSVQGRTGTLSRDTEERSDFVRLTMNDDGENVSGYAIEEDLIEGCTTNLDVVGRRRDNSCSE